MATLSELLTDPKRQLVIKQRQVAMEFGLEIERYLAKTRLKRSELAARIGKSRAWISKFLYGPRNLKVFTAVEIANAIDCDVELRLVPRQAELAIPRTADFVAQVHSAAQAMAQSGIGVPPPHPTVSSPGTVVAQGLRV